MTTNCSTISFIRKNKISQRSRGILQKWGISVNERSLHSDGNIVLFNQDPEFPFIDEIVIKSPSPLVRIVGFIHKRTGTVSIEDPNGKLVKKYFQ
jgi:hypothetical protein